MSYHYIKVLVQDRIGIVTLHRPEVLNALNLQLVYELVTELERIETDDSIRVIILTGNEKAFAAGADISEMAGEEAIPMLLKDQFVVWDRIAKISKPIIAAVSGFVLGGGCELMMNCDMIIASETTRIGQPEIQLGVMPGAGGTQRLTKAVGKVKAMEMLLTGEHITAEEALKFGLINKVVPVEMYFKEALRMAQQIALQPPVAVRLIKKSVLKAFDTSLAEGLDYERNCFYLLFSSEDKEEGMNAFLQKRKPKFTGR
ncbi:enoyl-CoA hydratase-related protein [Fodinisporobacter ferrooxydans]|uniref:Enoyl-CoA hydratase-related protein n=1 Tax=Fodinisporobacter ferrooxydans TaxID=2901836 RepID=A0ABY4CSR7_9BACL|nr:enoyl-CoA hydratase-related protein [Alicyclobacillaceae bacterium MYW30-H2]